MRPAKVTCGQKNIVNSIARTLGVPSETLLHLRDLFCSIRDRVCDRRAVIVADVD